MRYLVVVAAFVVFGTAASAYAGPGIGRGITRVQVTTNQRVLVTLDAQRDSLQTVKAGYVSSPTTFSAGRGCPTRATDYEIALVADRMGLAQSAVAQATRGKRGGMLILRRQTGTFRVTRTLNYGIVRAGLGRVTRQSSRYRRRLLRAQRSAKREHRGMWSRCNKQ